MSGPCSHTITKRTSSLRRWRHDWAVRIARVVVLLLATSAISAGAAIAAPNSQTFNYNDTTQYFTVPAGVHQVTSPGGAAAAGAEDMRPGCTPRRAAWVRTSISTRR